MQNKLFNPFVFLILIVFILIIYVLCEQKIASINKPDSIKDIDSNYIDVKREKFIFRHWQRSGIFLAGGYVPDPHFSVTEVFDFKPNILERINAKKGRFQGIDINRWFGDKTAESILALEIDNKTYEYNIDLSKNTETFSNYEFYESIVPFIYKEKIAFITGFDMGISILLIDLPLGKNNNIKTISYRDKEFSNIIRYLKEKQNFKGLKQGLCKQWKPYRNFYEQFEPCPPLDKWQGIENRR